MKNARFPSIFVCVLCLLFAATSFAQGEDEHWDPQFDLLGLSAAVNTIVADGSDVYLGGAFTIAGSVATTRVAWWNGFAWLTLGTGVSGPVHAIAVSGNDIYVGGDFSTAGGNAANNIARWNGTTWSSLGAGVANGVSGIVRALAVDGNDVYAGGEFTVAGGVGALRIARWNGSAWSALGTGASDDVMAIAVSGGDVLIGGLFTAAGGVGALRAARWNGSTWSALGSGLGGAIVYAIEVDGTDIYFGGDFTTAGGNAALNIARWNGASWSAVGSGVSNDVRAISAGSGSIFAAGDFTTAGGNAALRVAEWNGTTWSNLGSGATDRVLAIEASGLDVFIGGEFTTVGGKASRHFGRWNETIVPILIQAFDARIKDLAVELTWDIFADEPIASFRIFKSTHTSETFTDITQGAPISENVRSYTDQNVVPGEAYRYWLRVVTPGGDELSSPIISVIVPEAALQLSQSYPNPFNPATTIRFVLPSPTHATLRIFDGNGSLVRTLASSQHSAGPHQYEWRGENNNGHAVASGVYFYQLQANGQTLTRKLVLTK